MTGYVLQITFHSPLTSAAGEGRVGVVDRDVAFDDLGLPVLPGKRLKGLWREAYRDVADAWMSCGQSPMPADWIFGAPGQKPGDGDACLQVGNAELQEASDLKLWLTYMQHPKIQKLHPDDVVQHFATVRTQTAIDRRTGAALEDTLRLTRTLRTGLVFHAPLRFFEPPDATLLNALALGAAALKYMGTARTRGLGKVCCRLLSRDANGQWHDLTEEALKHGSLPSIAVPGLATPSPTSTGPTTPVFGSAPPTHLLRYKLTLTAPAVISGADGDPNTVVTRQDVPGSNVWGAAAWHYLRQAGHTPQDVVFRRAFLDGGLRFLAAYLEAHDPKETQEPPQRLIPIPHSIRKFKDAEQLVDFVEKRPKDPTDPTKRLDRRYGMLWQSFLGTQAVKTERNYHHARASKDRRIGRALGAEVPDGGAFFVYEAIQAGQSFQGAVLGSDADLQALQSWLAGGTSITVGRSRSAQYGKATFEWIADKPRALDETGSEWNGFVGRPSDAPEDSGNQLIVTTLSPLLALNNDGHPEARFPVRELAEVLGLDSCKLTLSSSYTRTELIGGYHAHLRLPRQQWPAIASGSVFVFDIICATINPERLARLEQDGLGLRKAEGYGRLAINRQGCLKLNGSTETHLDDPEELPSPDAPKETPESVQNLLRDVVRRRCLAEMQQRAVRVAEEIQKKGKLPSNALLGRLRLFLQQGTPVQNRESLKNLRSPAKAPLTECRIETREADLKWLIPEDETDNASPNQLALYGLFESAWTEPESLSRGLIESRIQEVAEACDDATCTAMCAKLVQDASQEMCHAFLSHLLTALHRQPRTSSDGTRKG